MKETSTIINLQALNHSHVAQEYSQFCTGNNEADEVCLLSTDLMVFWIQFKEGTGDGRFFMAGKDANRPVSDYRYVVIPINVDGNHWILAIVINWMGAFSVNKTPTHIIILDSLAGRHTKMVEWIRQLVKYEGISHALSDTHQAAPIPIFYPTVSM